MLKKNDPLVNAVQKVMEENALRYQVEKKLCEELGIYSRNALTNENKVNYDALLEQRISEALHPNQQKLDVHEPEKDKLTSQDFKMLRAKKTMKEEEQLDELSSKTYKSAMMKAVQKHTNASTLMQKDKKEKSYAQAKKFQKAGIAKEKQEKMMKEEDKKSSDPDMAAPGHSSQRGATNGQEIKAKVPADVPMPPKRPADLKEAAKSKAQQRIMGMALAMRRGESDRGSEKVAKMAADMSSAELKKFAKTKLKGLPEKVKKMDEDAISFNSVMEEIKRKLGAKKMKEIEEDIAGGGAAFAGADDTPAKVPAKKPEREPMKDLSGGADIAGGGMTGGKPAPEVSAPKPAAAPKIDVNKAISGAAEAPEVAAPTSQSIAKQAIKAPVQAGKGEGATGKALASSGIGKTERRSQEFVDKTLGAGKFKAGSAESNIALQKYSAGLQKAATPAATAPTPAARPAAAAPAARPAPAAASAAPTPAAPKPTVQSSLGTGAGGFGLSGVRSSVQPKAPRTASNMRESLESTIRNVLKD